MTSLQISKLEADDRDWVEERTTLLYGGPVMVSLGRKHDLLSLPGYIAWQADRRVGLVIYQIADDGCELVLLDAVTQWHGIGTLLLAAVENVARQEGCRRVWLTTTNDNVDALRFYQKRGYHLRALHLGSIGEARKTKAKIPQFGDYGIRLRDEIELDKKL